MKKLIASIVLVCVCLGGLALAASPVAPSQAPTDVETIKQLGQDLGDAMVAVDMDKLNQIFADDWLSIGLSGKVHAKESVLRDLKSGADKLTWFELGPIDVQVFGHVALAHGSVKERRIHDGKDTSGEFVYTDILEKRGGKWVIVRSAGARVK